MSYLKSFKLFVINLNFIKDIFNELTDTYTDIEVDYREKKDNFHPVIKCLQYSIGIESRRRDNSEIAILAIELANRVVQYYYEETGDEIVAFYHSGNYNYFNDKIVKFIIEKERSFAIYFNPKGFEMPNSTTGTFIIIN